MAIGAELEVRLAPIVSRRSVVRLGEPGPTVAQLDALLRAAVTVPDHGGLHPWRLVVIEGEARGAFGDALLADALVARPELPPAVQEKIRAKAFAAPAAIAIVARVDAASKVPQWEQVASAACAGYAITLAAHHLGLGAIWKSTPFVVGASLADALDMGAADHFLGWVNLGTPGEDEPARARVAVDLTPIARRLASDGTPTAWVGDE